MSRARHVLIVCAQCDGDDVGESWCGYEWVSRIARLVDVTVLTQRFPRGRPPSTQLPGVRVIEWPAAPFLDRFPRFNSALKPWYPLFHWRARRWIRSAMERGERFDLLHHLTPMAMRYPSPCSGLGVPYVVGPVAGSVETPAGFVRELETEPRYMRLRALDRWRLRFDPMMRRTYKDADTVICSAPYAARMLAPLGLTRVEIETEVGIASVGEKRSPRETVAGRLRLLHVGRIVRTKGLRDTIRALAQLGDLPGVTLDVAGEGEDLVACRAEAARLGVADRVRFLGRLPRGEVEALYSTADVFVFPSFREATGIVLFEAMRHGLPVITADTGGPGHIVDDACGVRVTPGEPGQFARDLAAAIRLLASNPSLRLGMGQRAEERCRELALWDHKIERLLEVYDDCVGRSMRRVELGETAELTACEAAR